MTIHITYALTILMERLQDILPTHLTKACNPSQHTTICDLNELTRLPTNLLSFCINLKEKDKSMNFLLQCSVWVAMVRYDESSCATFAVGKWITWLHVISLSHRGGPNKCEIHSYVRGVLHVIVASNTTSRSSRKTTYWFVTLLPKSNFLLLDLSFMYVCLVWMNKVCWFIQPLLTQKKKKRSKLKLSNWFLL